MDKLSKKIESIFVLIMFAIVFQGAALAAGGTPDVTSEDISTLREDMNAAISELNGKIQGLDAARKSSASISGKVFIGYEQNQVPNGTIPQFSLSRAYLDFKNSFSRDTAVRVTTDIERVTIMTTTNDATKADTRYDVFLKYAYFDLNNLGVPFVGLNTLRLGQAPTFWIDYMEKFWNYRYVQKTMTDYYSLFTSADIGVSALGLLNFADLGIPGLNQIEYASTYMNGTGYKKPDNNYEKDFALRVNTSPLSWVDGNGNLGKVTVGLGYFSGSRDQSALTSWLNCVTAMMALESQWPAKAVLFAELASPNMVEKGITGQGISAGGQYEIIPDLNVFARFDGYADDVTKMRALKQLSIAGLEYCFGDNVKLALDQQQEFQSGGLTTQKYSLHSQVMW